MLVVGPAFLGLGFGLSLLEWGWPFLLGVGVVPSFLGCGGCPFPFGGCPFVLRGGGWPFLPWDGVGLSLLEWGCFLLSVRVVPSFLGVALLSSVVGVGPSFPCWSGVGPSWWWLALPSWGPG